MNDLLYLITNDPCSINLRISIEIGLSNNPTNRPFYCSGSYLEIPKHMAHLLSVSEMSSLVSELPEELKPPQEEI